MKTIGIIGGLGPEATLDYYKRITSFFHDYNKSLSTPDIVIYSVDLAVVFRLLGEKNWDGLTELLAGKLAALGKAGADFAAISANTPHIVFDRVAALSPLPLISIVEVTLEAAKGMGLKRVGLLGTRFTMQADFFASTFARGGIAIVVPNEQEQQTIQDKLVTEIELGIFTEATRRQLVEIINRMRERDGIEAVILGCTEFPLILRDKDCELPLLNTTALHVGAICKACLGEE